MKMVPMTLIKLLDAYIKLQAVKRKKVLESAAFVESVMLNTPISLPQTAPDLSSLPTDTKAQNLLSTSLNAEDYIPIYVSGDGSCLFSAISVLLEGNELYACELRVRTCIEFHTQQSNYLSFQRFKELNKFGDFNHACVEIGIDRSEPLICGRVLLLVSVSKT